MPGTQNPPLPYCTCTPPPTTPEVALARNRVADSEACIASLRRMKPLTDDARARHRFELAVANDRYATQLALALREAYDAIVQVAPW
jgi:hypothetical protein